MANQVLRPMIPYRGCIPNGLHDGKQIEIRGFAPYNADVFTLNFLTNLNDYSDSEIALHLSVRFHISVVVRNTKHQNEWNTEERSGIFPFQQGKEFYMVILVQPSCYMIAVDNQHCWTFAHRIPFTRVNGILIDGSVQIDKINYIDKQYPVYPPYNLPQVNINPNGGYTISLSPQPAHSSDVLISKFVPVHNPTIPYAYPIYGGIQAGMNIHISGRPKPFANKFTVNFQEGSLRHPAPDIAFHFDVRFTNGTIVRNSRIKEVWDREETIIAHFPFQKSVSFEMTIRVLNDRFTVSLDGQHFIEFRHRLWPLSRFNTLLIENDIAVSSIIFT